jgi:short-subunit dehydrogenase
VGAFVRQAAEGGHKVLSLADRVAVVTGASSGIGAGLAAMLAAEGARVALAARRGEELERVAAEIRQAGGVAMPIVTDVADDDSLARLLSCTRAEFGPIDVLVNNAGFGLWTPLEATTIAEWDHTFAVNVRAAAYLCAAVLPGMQERRFGRVINIGSEAGVAIVPGLAAYCVSKHALGALTEVIQDANHDNGIKAWVVCPGFVDTEMGQVVPGANRDNFLLVDEVVDVVRFLVRLGDNVKIGPEVLVRTMRNPMKA